MSTVSETYINALLADATYALGTPEQGDLTGATGNRLTGYLSSRMTPTLAKYIGDNFTVLSHIETDDFFASGFDATVWKENSSGKLFVSMQGTSGLADWLADYELTLASNAGRQVVDMINWWLRISAPLGSSVTQYRYGPGSIEGAPWSFTTYVVAGENRVSASDLAAGVEVNGHSLGGYLATAFTRLFGKQAHVLHTSTFNSAGFAPGSETVFNQLQDLIGYGLGLGRFPNQTEQSNYFAKNGLNVTTTNSFWFSQQGERVEVFNEEGTGFPNHYMYKLIDTLALGAALEQLASGTTFPRLSSLVDAGSHRVEGSIEGVFDALARTLLGAGIASTPIGDVGDSADSRNAFHASLADLQKSAVFESLKGKVTLLAISPDAAADLGTQAKARLDFQTLVALQTLSPFVVNPANSEGQAALDSLWRSTPWNHSYTAWLEDKSHVTAGNEPANFTDQYLTDRALLLQTILVRNAQDLSLPIVNSKFGTFQDRVVDFKYCEGSSTSATSLALWGSAVSPPHQLIYFGNDKDNTISGTEETKFGDRLYGAGGNDIINGLGGDDYIEGNAGNDFLGGGTGYDVLLGGAGDDTLIGGDGHDLLLGGAGDDTYYFEGDVGLDIIRDSDGAGKIVIGSAGSVPLSGGKKLADNVWISDNRKFTYAVVEGNLIIRPSADSGVTGILTVKDWTNGQLGIFLGETLAPQPEPATTFNGDFVKKKNEAGDRYLLGPDGNYVANGPQANALDLITGSSEADRIQGLGGDDALLGRDGADSVEGGERGGWPLFPDRIHITNWRLAT